MAHHDTKNTTFYVAGSISGVVEVALTHPIDVIKTKIQQHSADGTRFTLNDIRTNGFRSLYSGIFTRMAGITPMRAMYWGTQDLVNKQLPILHPEISDSTRLVAAGVGAGFTQSLVDAPIEYMKTQQIRHNSTALSSVLKQIKFKGFGPTLYRNSSFAGIFSYIANSDDLRVEERLSCMGMNDKMASITKFGVAGFISSFLTQPLDYYKTYAQTFDNIPHKQIIADIKSVAAYDPTILWKGAVPRAVLGFCTMSIGGFMYRVILDTLTSYTD